MPNKDRPDTTSRTSLFNPEVAAPAIAAKTAQEGANIIDTTLNHYARFKYQKIRTHSGSETIVISSLPYGNKRTYTVMICPPVEEPKAPEELVLSDIKKFKFYLRNVLEECSTCTVIIKSIENISRYM